jgi:uncharacterized protein YecT (DUF1311 family)
MAPKPTASRWTSPDAQVSSTPTRRLIWRSYGEQKCGKTHFALTAPGPIFIQSFDIGLEGVVEEFLAKGKDIRALEYPFNPESYETEKATAEAANKLWKVFVADYAAALAEARTVVWDTESEVWELLRYARLGAASGAPKDYAVLNNEYRGLVRQAYGEGVNLGLLQKTKEKWISKMDPAKGKMVPHNTGEQAPIGMKEVGFLVQCNLKHERVLDDEMNKHYRITVEDVRHTAGQGLVGTQWDDMMDFPMLASNIFPETSAEDWQ